MVSQRYFLLKAAREVCYGDGFLARTASLDDLTPEVLAAFGELLIQPSGKVAFGNILGKLKKVYDLFKKIPSLWTKFKEILGIDSLTDIPGKIKEWVKAGADVLKKVIRKALEVFPLALFFVPKKKMPGLTDLLARLVKASPKLANALEKVKTNIIEPLDKMLNKHLPTLKRPLLAFAFAWVWINVAEISWDVEGLLRGFTGGISLGELFVSLPESGIGLIVGVLGGSSWSILPIILVARIAWLVAQKILEWVPKKGFLVHWREVGVDASPEQVPAF
jgi:hypothetical protein